MTTHRLPFENRWTNNANALQWNCELDHLGVANVRAMFVDHETRHPTRRRSVTAAADIMALSGATSTGRCPDVAEISPGPK